MDDSVKKIFITVVVIVSFLLILLLYTVVDAFVGEKRRQKRINAMMNGLEFEDKVELANKLKKKKEQNKKKNYPFKKFIDEYLYFGGNLRKLIITLIVGYLIMVLVYFILSKNILISISYGLYFFLIYYLITAKKLKKQRIKFLRSFSSSLEIISSALEAGNALETSFQTVTNRVNLHPKVLLEFAILNNDLVSGFSLEQALDKFWERNNMFNEVTMFVIVIQFYQKTGGRNTKQMFSDMKKSINNIIQGYSDVEARTSIYTMMIMIFTIISVGFTMVGGFFIKDFYESLTTSFTGILRMYGSMLLLIMSNWLQNSIIKNAAEA